MCNYLIYNELTRKFTPDSGGRNELRPYIMAAHSIVQVAIYFYRIAMKKIGYRFIDSTLYPASLSSLR